MTEVHRPSESARRTFVAKLAQFRNTLPASEQHMLDALVGAAVTASTHEALAHYWVGPRIHLTDFVAPCAWEPAHPRRRADAGSTH